MLEATKEAIEKLFNDEGRIIERDLLLALEDLYRSGKVQLPEEELWEDITKILDVSERIKANQNIGKKLELLFNEYSPLSQEIRVKYSDCLPDKTIDKIKYEEKYIEGFKQYIAVLTAFDLASKEPEDSIRFWKMYSSMVYFSELVEQHISDFPDWLLKTCEYTARIFLEDSDHQLERTDLSQEMTNHLKFIKNTARGILWQIENYKKEKKYPVEELLDWLELAPGWAGDDFEECLDYVNQVRK